MEPRAPIARLLLLALPFILFGRFALAQPCPGDCDGDGQIAIDELVKARRIADNAPGATLGDCEAADLDDDGSVDGDEVAEIEDEAVARCAPEPAAPPPPPQPVSINAAGLSANPGSMLAMRVSVTAPSESVAAFQNYLAYGSATRFLANQSGDPDCSLSDPVAGALATFAFSPSGCDPVSDCERVLAFIDARAIGVSLGTLKIVYRCQVQVAADAPTQFHPIPLVGVAAADAEGNALATTAFNGGVLVRPPATPTPTVTNTPTVTPTPIDTETPTATSTPTPSQAGTATNTPTPTPTFTRSRTATFTPTSTNDTPSPTITLTPTATPTATAPTADCTGDCDGNGTVAVAEVVRAVGIGLGAGSVGDCPSLDANDDGVAGVDELVASVGDSLETCAVEPVR